MKVSTAIELLESLDKNEDIIITWWSVDDINEVLDSEDLPLTAISLEEKQNIIRSIDDDIPEEMFNSIRESMVDYVMLAISEKKN